jgi:hypothetical protein
MPGLTSRTYIIDFKLFEINNILLGVTAEFRVRKGSIHFSTMCLRPFIYIPITKKGPLEGSEILESREIDGKKIKCVKEPINNVEFTHADLRMAYKIMLLLSISVNPERPALFYWFESILYSQEDGMFEKIRKAIGKEIGDEELIILLNSEPKEIPKEMEIIGPKSKKNKRIFSKPSKISVLNKLVEHLRQNIIVRTPVLDPDCFNINAQ